MDKKEEKIINNDGDIESKEIESESLNDESSVDENTFVPNFSNREKPKNWEKKKK